MKKLLAVLLIVALVLPLAASVAVAQDKPYIAIVSKGFQHQFWQVVAKGAQAAAEKYGVEKFRRNAFHNQSEAQKNRFGRL